MYTLLHFPTKKSVIDSCVVLILRFSCMGASFIAVLIIECFSNFISSVQFGKAWHRLRLTFFSPFLSP